MSSSLESERADAVAAYGTVAAGLYWRRVEPSGFSGALVWRGEDAAGQPVLALKAWPPGGMPRERLEQIHGWMREAAGLEFVPRVLATTASESVLEYGGRLWDLGTWMPGTADFRDHPSPARLAAACTALARLHRTWAHHRRIVPECPGIRRRLRLLDDWESIRSGIGSGLNRFHPDLAEAVCRGIEVLLRHAGPARAVLEGRLPTPVTLQPCLCDIWHDHLLFAGDVVSGVIDYGAMKEDHIAVDLARLLGDLVGDDDAAFGAGLAAYARAGGMLDVPVEFVRELDRTGALCGLAFWLQRLTERNANFDQARIGTRIATFCSRFENSSLNVWMI
jgi:homoserine kinase type II